MHMYVCMYVCIHVCMYVRMYVCMYVCVCACINWYQNISAVPRNYTRGPPLLDAQITPLSPDTQCHGSRLF